MKRLLTIAFLAVPIACEQQPAQQEGQLEASQSDNAEMAALFEADQAARRGDSSSPMNWLTIAQEDRARRTRTREMIDEGALQTGRDFYRAAFVFQHGSEPNDYLLAHALAVTAIQLGYDEANWISAATLDRYLRSLEQPQIYGTQYRTYGPKDEEHATMGDYDDELITDQIRAISDVPSRVDQPDRKTAN